MKIAEHFNRTLDSGGARMSILRSWANCADLNDPGNQARKPTRARAAPSVAFVATLSLSLGCMTIGIKPPQSVAVTPEPSSTSTALSATNRPNLAAVPEWALATPGKAQRSEIGIGSGTTLDQATRYALQDVASRISVSVESQLTDTYREHDGTSVESLEHVIETRVTGTQFAGWERTRAAEREGIFWAEVRIDRRRLTRDSMSELIRVAKEVDTQLESARGSALRRLLALQTTGPDRERASTLIALLDVLDLEFDRTAWEARRADWRQIDEAARRALVFEVRADSDSREIARWVESRLVAGRLRTRAGECISTDAICIDIRSEFTEADVASRHMAKVRATLAVLEPSGTVVQEGNLIGRGDSKADASRARHNALKDLRRGLTSFGFLEGLTRP